MPKLRKETLEKRRRRKQWRKDNRRRAERLAQEALRTGEIDLSKIDLSIDYTRELVYTGGITQGELEQRRKQAKVLPQGALARCAWCDQPFLKHRPEMAFCSIEHEIRFKQVMHQHFHKEVKRR